ncbi:hypothetical protein SynPROSU1_01795 [Synechococcus sp. PROS-U-1]|nr:hypothetical protein SynPROSU1_01795 [Synechococcus sp. PROS-U-1]
MVGVFLRVHQEQNLLGNFFVHFDRLGCTGGGGWSGSNFSSASDGTKQLTSRNKDDAEMISVFLHHPCLVFLLKMS